MAKDSGSWHIRRGDEWSIVFSTEPSSVDIDHVVGLIKEGYYSGEIAYDGVVVSEE